MTGPSSNLSVRLTGGGPPVTVVAHGLGATLPETRVLVGGVPGTRVLFAARGHGPGRRPVAPGWGELADDLEAVADAHLATRALGVSLGAATLLQLLSRRPTRFDRVVLLLPAAVDQPRSGDVVRRLHALADALQRQDEGAVHAAVLAELPGDLLAEPAVQAYARTRTEHLLACEGLPELIGVLADRPPVADRTLLSAVTAEVLVVGQEGDPLHPADLARDLAASLPRCRLVVFDRPGMALRDRARLRAEIAEFLRD